MQDVPGRIAFLGGAFDPPHLGHTMLARRALELGLTDLVLWVPSWCPPHKERGRMTPFADRLAMTKLAAAKVPHSLVSDFEARKRFEPSYSVRVLSALEEEFPGSRMQLLIGQDSLEQLHTWREPKALAERFEIIAFPRRAGGASEDGVLHLAEEFWGAELTRKLRASLAEGGFVEISSTNLRSALANGEDVRHIIDEDVKQYIAEHALYGTGSTGNQR